ncbi:MAG: hypothetical protein FWG21_04810, partial [Oscillospiraceae bacterium]|nr:hypothetical protein [Oscillospiraceae bacterium]
MVSWIKRHKINIFFCGIGLVYVFLHFFKLSDVPRGINVDEAGMGYDAYCLANFGVSRDLLPFPLYLVNYGGGQSALYAHLASFFI